MNLHTDDELTRLLGQPIRERTTIHQWPLSIVQCLTLTDGTRLAYKSQLPPTVEPEFYARAASPLLTRCRDLGVLGDCHILVLDWIETRVAIDVTHARQVVDAIGGIKGDPPVYTDIGTPDAWAATVADTFDKLSRFHHGPVDELRRWAESPAVMQKIAEGSRVCHGDLKPEQVFLTENGYRLIDWQRPVKGPADLDLVCLLIELAVDPLAYTDAATVQLHWFLRLRWVVESRVDIFPGVKNDFLDHWPAKAIERIPRIGR